jgi:hypothetical protein
MPSGAAGRGELVEVECVDLYADGIVCTVGSGARAARTKAEKANHKKQVRTSTVGPIL